MDRVSNDGYKSCRGLRIYSQALLWNSASCRRRVRALRSLSALSPLSLRSLSLALSSNATTLNHLIRLRGSPGIQIWKQRTCPTKKPRRPRLADGSSPHFTHPSLPTFSSFGAASMMMCCSARPTSSNAPSVLSADRIGRNIM